MAMRTWAAAGLALGLGFAPALGDDKLAQYYGFLPPEIYKLDPRTQNLLVVDINGDKLNDLVIVNPGKNQLDVLVQQKNPRDGATANVGVEANDIPNPGRLKHRRIPMSRPVNGLCVHDVNGDGKPDLVYMGAEPNGLYVEYQDAEGNFGDRRSFEIEEAVSGGWSVDVGDLNGDGRDDIVFLAKGTLYVIHQNAAGKLDDPKKYRISGEEPGLLKLVDLDGDGRLDVVYIIEDNQFPVRLRLQTKDGQLGPERQLEIEKPKAVSYGKLDPNRRGMDMLTISKTASRLLAYRLGEAKPRDDRPACQVVAYPFERTGARSGDVDLVVADFDGDGKADVVATDGGGARVLLYRQAGSDGVDLGSAYPGMLGTTSLRALTVPGENRARLLALSPNEKTIGSSVFDGQRLSFPQPLPTKDEPVALEVLGSGADARVAYVARVEPGKDTPQKYLLRTLKASGAGYAPAKLGAAAEIDLGLAEKPLALRAADANEDGIPDLLVFANEDEAPALWLGAADGGFVATPKSGAGSFGVVPPSATLARRLADGKPAVVVAQNNFARRMAWDAGQSRWRVVEQFNAPGANARVAAAEFIDIDNDGVAEAALYDRASQSVAFLKLRDGRWERHSQVKVGSFGLKGLRVADFNGDGKPDLLLFDNDRFGVIYNGKTDLVLDQIANYESDERRGQLFDVAAGDVNNDGRIDLVCMDSQQHNLEILAVGPAAKLTRALRWQVYEEKTFRQMSGRNIEPREIALGDVDGDGRQDIMALVHDRLVVYLQDPGTDQPAPARTGIAANPTAPAVKPEMKAPERKPAVVGALPSAPGKAPNLGNAPAAAGTRKAINDTAGFFNPVTLAKAESVLSRFRELAQRDVVVETFADVPEADRERFKALDNAAKTTYMGTWAKSRRDALKVNGTFLLVCKSVRKFHVEGTAGLVTTTDQKTLSSGISKALANTKGDWDAALMQFAKDSVTLLGKPKD